MIEREPKPSELMMNDIYGCIRNLDKLMMKENPIYNRDIEEQVAIIKMRLDEMVKQFKLEVGETKFSNPISTPLPATVFEKSKPKEWHCTPIIDGNMPS